MVAQLLIDAYPPPLLIAAQAHLLSVGFMPVMVMGRGHRNVPAPRV